MVIAEVVTMLIYIGSMWLLPTYFGGYSVVISTEIVTKHYLY